MKSKVKKLGFAVFLVVGFAILLFPFGCGTDLGTDGGTDGGGGGGNGSCSEADSCCTTENGIQVVGVMCPTGQCPSWTTFSVHDAYYDMDVCSCNACS